MPKRIKMISVPFNHKWPNSARISVVRELGAYPVGTGRGMLDPDIAKAALAAGAAIPFDPAPAKPKTPRKPRAIKAAASKPAE